MAVSHVALLFTDVLDQITDTLEPIGFIMRNFNPGKVLKSNKELDPIKAMMQKKLELKGQMTTIVKYVNASKELVEAATRVQTRFLDEKQ